MINMEYNWLENEDRWFCCSEVSYCNGCENYRQCDNIHYCYVCEEGFCCGYTYLDNFGENVCFRCLDNNCVGVNECGCEDEDGEEVEDCNCDKNDKCKNCGYKPDGTGYDLDGDIYCVDCL